MSQNFTNVTVVIRLIYRLFPERINFYRNLSLPVSEGEVDSGKKPKNRVLKIALGQEVKALVVDDNLLNLKVLETFLVSMGLEVVKAENGKIGFEMVEKHQPDIVFMDVNMPVMGGIEAT
jgi:PleD family two-component response regulator